MASPTVAELKAELDSLGIVYPSGAKKADLEGMLAEARGDIPTEPPAEEEPVEEEVVENIVDDHPDPAEHVICPACGNTFRPDSAETIIS